MSALGRSFLIIGDADVALEYLEKNSANTSDRPDVPLV